MTVTVLPLSAPFSQPPQEEQWMQKVRYYHYQYVVEAYKQE
jgi:hypothetical protein